MRLSFSALSLFLWCLRDYCYYYCCCFDLPQRMEAIKRAGKEREAKIALKGRKEGEISLYGSLRGEGTSSKFRDDAVFFLKI